MNFFSARKAWGWAANFFFVLLILCVPVTHAAPLRIGLLNEAAPFDAILADEVSILFTAPQWVRLTSREEALNKATV